MNSSLAVHCLVVSSRLPADPRAAGLLKDAHALGLSAVTGLAVQDLYFVEGELAPADLERLAEELLHDPVAQTASWRGSQAPLADGRVIEIALRPGVTDPVADQIVRCAHVLGIQGVTRAATGQRFGVHGKERITDAELHTLARRLLANPVIHHYALGQIQPSFPQPAEASGQVDLVPIRELEPNELLALSRERRAALDLAEMQAIQHYYRNEGRDPTDVEFETIAQTWSEHCVHKTFKARITVEDGRLEVRDWGLAPNPQPLAPIDGLLKTYLRAATERIAAPWVRSAFVDNAGVIDFDDDHEVSFKVETHNHPSAIEPFGGANTGVGGVIRDVLGVSAKPIAATDVLCFGPQDLDPRALPEGVLHPRRIRSGVVAGVQDYGNKIGIPTVNGALWYDAGFTANPLVFCGCVGLAPKDKHPSGARPGEHVIVLGGRTGRDGLRGATFSSMTMDAQTGEVAGASVQIGDPITEKGLIEVIVRARDLGLYHAVTDCGAGGLSSAVGEMAKDTGADIDLAHVPLKYPGLAPWEIWLSEAQERMVLAVPESGLTELRALCHTFNTAMTDLGTFTGTGRLVVRYGERLVLDVANDFLHNGLPQRSLVARVDVNGSRAEAGERQARRGVSPRLPDPRVLARIILKLLAHPNIASKADVIRIYDHEVQGGTAVKPLTGAQADGPSDACVIKPLGTAGARGIVLSNGLNPEFGKLDPYRMAVSVVDEAIRNAVAVGADPERIALLDNFCWGDPLRPDVLGGLVQAARGCHDAALHYRAPFVSGKDSLNNEYLGADGLRHAIPPTLLISAIGLIEDIGRAVTMDLKEPGNAVYLLGETLPELGGSHLALVDRGKLADGPVPGMPARAPASYQALHRAMADGLVRACHDLSEGGLAVAAAEMCIGGRLGLALTVDADNPMVALFSESNGRLLIEVRPEDRPAFEAHFVNVPGLPPISCLQRIGTVTSVPRLSLTSRTRELASLAVSDLVTAWQTLPPEPPSGKRKSSGRSTVAKRRSALAKRRGTRR